MLLVFPTNHKKNSTVRILKTPKTESSVRKIFLPKSVSNMLVDWKAEQDEMKEILGDEYMDYNLPPVVFHSFRHSSVAYKLRIWIHRCMYSSKIIMQLLPMKSIRNFWQKYWLKNDEQITTHSGDIVLYSGDKIVVFYGSNSWAYTRLGKMNIPEGDVTELLSNGDITLKIVIAK